MLPNNLIQELGSMARAVRLKLTARWLPFLVASVLTVGTAHGASLNLRQSDQVRRALTAVGYCIGQEHSLSAIERQPGLTRDVALYRARFNSAFPDACRNLEQAVEHAIRYANVNWNQIREDLLTKIAMLLKDPQSPTEAKSMLASLEPRLNGEIEPAVLSFLLAASTPNLRDPSWEMRQGWKSEYRTDEHPKAKGVRLHIQVPRSWKAEEGRRPNIVQKWTSQGGQGLNTVLVQIKSAEPDLIATWQSLKDDRAIRPTCEALVAGTSKVELTGSRRVAVEGQDALICSYLTTMERMDSSITMANEFLVFPWGRGLIMILSMSAYTDPADRDEAVRDAKALLSAVGNSIVLPERY